MSEVKLKLVSRAFDGFERAFAQQIASFESENPGIKVDAEFFELGPYHEKMLANRGAANGEADLFLSVTDWMPEASSNGQLLALDPFLEADPPEDWPDGWSPSMRGLQTGADGKTYGIAYHDGPEVFMYRTDLFGDFAEQSAFRLRFGYELAPPKTWDEFVDIAQFFTRPEKGLWGCCLAGFPDAHNNIYDFMLHLWSRGGQLMDADFQPQFHKEAGHLALHFLVDLVHNHKVVDPACLDLDSVASGLYYASGKAAMMWNWSGFAAVAEEPTASQIVGKNACCAMPAASRGGRSVSLNIYWVLCITSGSKHKAEGYRFLKHVASSAMDKVTTMSGGNGTRLSTWRDHEVHSRFPYYAIIEEVHRDVESPPQDARFPEVAEILNRMVDDALRLRATPEEALARAAAQVDELCATKRTAG